MTKTILLGICLVAILGLALGPVLETASAHVAGKVVGHESISKLAHVASDIHDVCKLGNGEQNGALHFVDTNGDGIHNHLTVKGSHLPDEPTVCMPLKKLVGPGPGPRK